MEAQQLQTASAIPEAIWKKIIQLYITDNMANVETRYPKTILKTIFRFKMTAKNLNQLFDDETLWALLEGRGYRRLRRQFYKLRIKSLTEIGNIKRLSRVWDMVKKKHHLASYMTTHHLLAVVKRLDLDLLQEFGAFVPFSSYHTFELLKGIRYAYQHHNQPIIHHLILKAPIRARYSNGITKWNQEKLLKALEDKQLNFDERSYYNLAEIISFETLEEDELDERIEALFRKKNPQADSDQQVVIVPKGELLKIEKLVQNRGFKREWTNFCIRPKKETNRLTLSYREKNGTVHDIDVTSIDQSDSSQPVTYNYEGLSTQNVSELILCTSLRQKIFQGLPHRLIAPTKELLELPYEQQPWFMGIISSTARAAMLSEHTSVFFTYSSNNHVYLVSNISLSHPGHFSGSIVRLAGENISKYFPSEKFLLGMHNEGKIVGLAEHLVRRAVGEGDIIKTTQLLIEHNLDLKTNKLFAQPDNMVKSYISTTKKEVINNDMVLWLLENDAPLPVENGPYIYHSTIQNAISTCDGRVIKALANKGQTTINNFTLTSIMGQGYDYDVLKACVKRYYESDNPSDYHSTSSPIHYFMPNLIKGIYSSVTYKVKTFIMAAWKYDSNSLFSQLPKEILLEILSYDGIDEPPYWDFLHFIVESFQKAHQPEKLQEEEIARLVPLVWKYWDLPSFAKFKIEVTGALFNRNYSKLHKENSPLLDTLLDWSLKYLQRMPVEPKSGIPEHPSLLTQYCLHTISDKALSMLKLIIAKKLCTNFDYGYFWVESQNNNIYIAAGFIAILADNKPAIDLLLDHDLLVENYAHNQTLNRLFERYPETLHWRQYIFDYRTKKFNEAKKNNNK